MSNPEFSNWEEMRDRFIGRTSSSTEGTTSYPSDYRAEYFLKMKRDLAMEQMKYKSEQPVIRYRVMDPPRLKAYDPEEEVKIDEPRTYEIKIDEYIEGFSDHVEDAKQYMRGYIDGTTPPKKEPEEAPAPPKKDQEFIFDPEALDI